MGMFDGFHPLPPGGAPPLYSAPSRCEPISRFPLLPGAAACPVAPSAAASPSRCEPFPAIPLPPGRRGASSRQSVEQYCGVEHRCAHADHSVRTRPPRAHGREFPFFPCAPEAFSRTGLTSCARDRGGRGSTQKPRLCHLCPGAVISAEYRKGVVFCTGRAYKRLPYRRGPFFVRKPRTVALYLFVSLHGSSVPDGSCRYSVPG